MRTFRLGERRIDLAASIVVHQGVSTPLTAIEANLLRHLARRAGDVVSREELLVEVWGYRPGVVSRTIDNTAARLRQKIEDVAANPVHLLSLYGRGLRLDGVRLDEPPETGSNPFVGRADGLAEVVGTFRAGGRLITITGPAGVGKSRLAAQVLPRLGLEPIEVSCGSVRDAADLDEAVSATLGSDAHLVGSVLARSGDAVLVLDECELAVEIVRQRVATWLGEAPRLRVLATARVPLDLSTERVIALQPLGEGEATELFLLGLRRVRASPDPDPSAVASVVGQLEGLPLAIELAAVRAAVIGVEALAGLLSSPLEVLSGRGRRSMAEVLERSFVALSRDERETVLYASAFEGPFDVADLAAILDLPIGRTLDRLERTSAWSLTRLRPDGRIELYAVVRERARRDAPPEAFARHGRWFGRLGEPSFLVDGRLGSATLAYGDTLRHLRRAAPDLQVAFARAAERGDGEAAERCGLALVWSLARQGSAAAGLELVERAAPFVRAPRSRLLFAVARSLLFLSVGELDASVTVLEAAVPLASEPSDHVAARCSLATSRRRLGDLDGTRRALEEARPFAPLSGPFEAHWYHFVGLYVAPQGEGGPLLRESARIARRHRDPHREVLALTDLTATLERRGDWGEIDVIEERIGELCRATDVPMRARSYGITSIGRSLRIRGHLDAAEPLLEEGVELARRSGMIDAFASFRLELLRVWLQRGRPEDVLPEVEPLAWETSRPSVVTSEALTLLGELHLRADDPERARVMLDGALDHARAGRWTQLEAQALMLLAVARDEPALLAVAAALDRSRVGAVGRDALTALLAARLGDLDAAREAAARARAAMVTLGLTEESEPAWWLERAERAIGVADRSILPFEA